MASPAPITGKDGGFAFNPKKVALDDFRAQRVVAPGLGEAPDMPSINPLSNVAGGGTPAVAPVSVTPTSQPVPVSTTPRYKGYGEEGRGVLDLGAGVFNVGTFTDLLNDMNRQGGGYDPSRFAATMGGTPQAAVNTVMSTPFQTQLSFVNPATGMRRVMSTSSAPGSAAYEAAIQRALRDGFQQENAFAGDRNALIDQLNVLRPGVFTRPEATA